MINGDQCRKTYSSRMKPCHQNGEAVPQIHVMASSLKTQNLEKRDTAVIGPLTSTLLPFEQKLYDIYIIFLYT